MNSTSTPFCKLEYLLSPMFLACCSRALIVVKTTGLGVRPPFSGPRISEVRATRSCFRRREYPLSPIFLPAVAGL